MFMIARVATRGTDVKRKIMTDFVVADFAHRYVGTNGMKADG